MKLIDYRLQKEIESLKRGGSIDYFKDQIESILSAKDKPYYRKADYIGLSLLELQKKIDYLLSDISELQALKKRMSESLNIAKEVVALVFKESGVEKIEGSIISSLSINRESKREKEEIEVLNRDALMNMGYIKYELDLEAIKKDIEDIDKKESLKELIVIKRDSTITKAKIKVNQKRADTKTATQADELEALLREHISKEGAA